MNRRRFLTALAGVPLVGRLVPKAKPVEWLPLPEFIDRRFWSPGDRVKLMSSPGVTWEISHDFMAWRQA